MSVILLNVEAYLDLAKAHQHDTYEKQARAAGLGVATIHRLRNGGPAGPKVIPALLTAYGVEFADLFRLDVTKPRPRRAKKAVAA